MPALKLNFPHQLGREEAQNRLRGLLEKVKARHGDKFSDLRESWVNNVLNFGFRTYGFNIDGNVTVDDSEVRLDGRSHLPRSCSREKSNRNCEIR